MMTLHELRSHQTRRYTIQISADHDHPVKQGSERSPVYKSQPYITVMILYGYSL